MFGISTPLHFYQKLVQEFDDFCETPSSARHAMNFVITAHHMSDWVWVGFLSKDQVKRKQLGLDNKNVHGFRGWLYAQSIWLAQMQPLANGSKHFQPGGMSIHMHHVGPFNSTAFNEVAFNEGFSYFVVDMGELSGLPNIMPATFLFEVVLRFWRDFLRLHSPYPELPKGRTLLSDEQPVGQQA
jgi:hypothetical protein